MNSSITNVFRVNYVQKKPTEDDIRQLNVKMNELIFKISSTDNYSDAETSLYELGDVQFALAAALFKWKISLPARCKLLVKQYDRPDDSDLRRSVYQRIKSNTFFIEGGAQRKTNE